eukprot:2712492-Lingulodinium_polyedra.AAC.1
MGSGRYDGPRRVYMCYAEKAPAGATPRAVASSQWRGLRISGSPPRLVGVDGAEPTVSRRRFRRARL